PVDINQAVLTGCEAPQALLNHGDLRRGHELSHDLAEEDLGVGVLVDLVPLGDRFDKIALGALGEPVPRLAGPGLASVEVVGVTLAVDMSHGHGGTSMIPAVSLIALSVALESVPRPPSCLSP